MSSLWGWNARFCPHYVACTQTHSHTHPPPPDSLAWLLRDVLVFSVGDGLSHASGRREAEDASDGGWEYFSIFITPPPHPSSPPLGQTSVYFLPNLSFTFEHFCNHFLSTLAAHQSNSLKYPYNISALLIWRLAVCDLKIYYQHGSCTATSCPESVGNMNPILRSYVVVLSSAQVIIALLHLSCFSSIQRKIWSNKHFLFFLDFMGTVSPLLFVFTSPTCMFISSWSHIGVHK